MNLTRKGVFLLIVFCGALLCVCPDTVVSAAQQALYLCFDTVIPSLFPFFVISSFAVNTGFISAVGNLISPLAQTLFAVSGSGAATFVVGLLCGSPTGAKTVAELYKNGMIEKKEAERLLSFCNNAGPLFVIGAVGRMAESVSIGKTLYLIHVLSAIITGVLLSVGHKRQQKRADTPVFAARIEEAFTGAVTGSVTAILNVCGYIVLFSVAHSFCLPFLMKTLGQSPAALLIGGFLEMTVGAKNICASSLGESLKLILLSAVLGFGGLCIFFQVCSAVRETDLSVKAYLSGKLLQAGVAAILTKLFLGARGNFKTVSFQILGEYMFFGALIIFFVWVLCFVDKRLKNAYNRENRG